MQIAWDKHKAKTVSGSARAGHRTRALIRGGSQSRFQPRRVRTSLGLEGNLDKQKKGTNSQIKRRYRNASASYSRLRAVSARLPITRVL